jgi:hypothetical protein
MPLTEKSLEQVPFDPALYAYTDEVKQVELPPAVFITERIDWLDQAHEERYWDIEHILLWAGLSFYFAVLVVLALNGSIATT